MDIKLGGIAEVIKDSCPIYGMGVFFPETAALAKQLHICRSDEGKMRKET